MVLPKLEVPRGVVSSQNVSVLEIILQHIPRLPGQGFHSRRYRLSAN